jgi:hypothetical protein
MTSHQSLSGSKAGHFELSYRANALFPHIAAW